VLSKKQENIRILFIHFRSYGDLIISLNALIPISSISPDITVDVITNDSNAMLLFKYFLKSKKIFLTNYPLFLREKPLSFIKLKNFIKLIFQLRRNKYDYCLNIFSALRENLFGYLVGPKQNLAPYWAHNHSFKNTIKRPNYFIKKNIYIPVYKKNIYEIINNIVKHFGAKNLIHDNIADNISNNIKIIGIHPFARQRCKLWSFEKWIKLIKLINNKGFHVWIFCSKDELSLAKKYFYEVINNQNTLHADTLEIFIKKLSNVSLLIGLDSFSIHLAYFLNVPRIMLNGANDPEIWLPPFTKVFNNGSKCKFHPCYNKPKCIGSDFEFVCIKSIEVKEVYSYIINKLLIINERDIINEQ